MPSPTDVRDFLYFCPLDFLDTVQWQCRVYMLQYYVDVMYYDDVPYEKK